jgi:arginyl-tRNA synthetase
MEQIKETIHATCQELFNIDVSAELTRPDEQFGDYSTNVAMQLAGKIGKNPREIADQLAEELRIRLSDVVSDISVAGPGFLNIKLQDKTLISGAKTTPAKNRKSQKVVIETNNPNPFKAMHIGHAYNAIVPDTLANLLEADGAVVHRVSYHGDVGTHVGKSMYSLLKFVDGDPNKLNEINPEERNSFMSKMYTEGAQAYKEDEQAKKEIDELAKQSFMLDDPLYKKVYNTCKEWSFMSIDQIIARLGNKPIEKRYLESEADAKGVDTVKAHVGDIFIQSDGAYVFPGERYGIFDNIFVSSQGRGLYGARDLGLMQMKHEDYQADKSYIVTGGEQKEYFRGVIKAAELSLPELKGVTVNIPTGLVKLSTGKMSSRTGDVLDINWLFEQLATAVIARGGEATDQMIASALRYQFLKVRIGSDVVFDVNESVSIHGNSGPYLQYAHARARSILEKSEKTTEQPTSLAAEERSLVRKIDEFKDVIERATEELMPHHICTYLYELAQSFNRFYEHNRVIGSDREPQRLWLVKTYADTLQSGLQILGIHAPENM